MNYNAQNFKSYKASKMANKTHFSIQEMLETRIRIESLLPTITMLDKDYSRRVFVDCESYYTQSGFDFLGVENVDAKTQRLTLRVDFSKLDRFLDDYNNDEFSSLDQALSILALGNPVEILKSEAFIERTLRHNKEIKKRQICGSMMKNRSHVDDMIGKFKSFDKQARTIIDSAHKYMDNNPIL